MLLHTKPSNNHESKNICTSYALYASGLLAITPNIIICRKLQKLAYMKFELTTFPSNRFLNSPFCPPGPASF